jgi:hypothetical protein
MNPGQGSRGGLARRAIPHLAALLAAERAAGMLRLGAVSRAEPAEAAVKTVVFYVERPVDHRDDWRSLRASAVLTATRTTRKRFC